MEKPERGKIELGRARNFLHCVILEQQAATEELRASNEELERLLDEVLASRSELRSISWEESGAKTCSSVRPDPPDRSAAELKREAERILEKAGETIQESMRLRRRSQRIREALRKAPSKPADALPQSLSRREHQVLTLIVAGKSSKEIAAELGISFKTAVTHRASIMSKLDVHEIASVVREAIRRGLV